MTHRYNQSVSDCNQTPEDTMIKGVNADYSRAHYCVIQQGIYPIVSPHYRVDTIRCYGSGEINLRDTIAIKVKTKPIEEVLPKIPENLRGYALKVYTSLVEFKARGHKSYWKHNIDGKRYAYIRELLLTDEIGILHEDLLTREQFVRTKKNFYENFTEVR